MSYVKAKTDRDIYVVNTKKLKGVTIEKYLAFGLRPGNADKYNFRPAFTLKPGEIFSKPFIKEFKDSDGNAWISTKPYTTGVTAFIKAPAGSYELTGDVLTEDEHSKINKERDESFARQAIKAGKSVLLIVLAALAAWFVFKND